MSFRVVFWPYDHEFLLQYAGTGDSSILEAIDEHADRETEYDRDASDAWRRAREHARAVILEGFPATGTFQEDDSHRNAVEILVYLCKHECRYPDHDFNYLEFLDTTSTIFKPSPSVSDALHYGRPWFGGRCGPEDEYGTLETAECKAIAQRCVQQRDQFPNPEWQIDPIRDIFMYASDRQCQLWFTI